MFAVDRKMHHVPVIYGRRALCLGDVIDKYVRERDGAVTVRNSGCIKLHVYFGLLAGV